MKNKLTFLILFLLFVTANQLLAQKKVHHKKKFIYKKHTQIDFSGATVQGKHRAPAIFYIFQRKRSKGHKISNIPNDFNYHIEHSIKEFKEALINE